MFEGTGKYFLMLFIVFFIVYLTVKICLGKIFKSAKLPVWKAYIPFYNRLVLTDLLDLKRTVFYKTLIPFGNLYYYNIIIKELLKAYKLDPKDSIWFILIPMYKFPELVFKNPKFMLHMYDDTEEFISNQNILFEKESNVPKEININETKPNTVNQSEVIINPNTYNQMNNEIKEENINYTNDSVFSNNSLEPDERKETIIEAKKEDKKEEKPIITDPGKPKVCPNCGTKLSPAATTCFLCGTKIL